HNLKIGTIADLIQYRSENESMIRRLGSKTLKTPFGQFEAVSYQDSMSGAGHIALVHGEIQPEQETLVRVHEPVSVLDLLDLERNAHSWGISQALQAISASQAGVLVMLNCQGSPGALVEALEKWGDAEGCARKDERYDLRTYGIGAQILRELHVGKMRLLALPRKMPSM